MLKNAKMYCCRAALKEFRSSANPKLKKISLLKLSSLQDHTKENTRIGGSRVTFVFN